MIIKELFTLIHNLLIIIQLITPHTASGLQNRTSIMIPLQPPLRLIPINHPSIIPRVDITSQPLLVTVKLLAYEVHFSGENGLVVETAQVVGVGRDVASDAVGVVEGADCGGELGGYHGHSTRCAQGRRAVGGVEDDTIRGEFVEVGGYDLGVRVVHLEEGSGELVGHDVKDVGLGLWHWRRRHVDGRGRCVRGRGGDFVEGVDVGGHDCG